MNAVHVTPALATLLLLSGTVAWAQDAAPGAATQAVSISTRVTVNETVTDNVALSGTSAKSDQITEISPGIHVNINGARLKTYFDYSLTHVNYAQGTAASRNQNALNTFGTLEAVDNWAFLDFSGNISQQTISAFGTQSNNNTTINANRTEVASYSLSPYVKGRLGDAANYEARISRAVSSSDSATASDTATTNSVVKVSNASAYRSLGWTADLSRQQASYSAGRTTETDTYSLGLTYEVSPQVKLSANAGQESNNYSSLDKQNYSTSSVGINWFPSERTSLSALTGKRSFGNTHNVSLEHRSARTVWRFSDSKDVSTTPNQNGVGTIGNLYDLFYSQLEGSGLSATERAQRVNALLQLYGLSANTPVVGGFLTSAISVQRSQNLSLALLGIRDTITFLLSRTESNRLDTVTSVVDNLSNGVTVIQNGFSVNYSHRLTPDYSLGVSLSRQDTSGTTTAEETTLRSFHVNISGKVGRRTAASLGLRRVVSDNATNPYTENAVTGNLNVQF
ncbi:TIGR03016 family PEP-CTERM system-associated outer membrane protein [Rhodoferax sp. U11-2br]|uniref:TIGR03016 family PEP-CTERM system-associated outer membrane protein n=1 Tax=Rhodoferax sp. U11-2br TaxID=2838878 RepID=UPI001BE4F612|nr:TIGR03016 family PEP-CTERM system-associated outer membrane protein [Rhodoferax sp. U11-2br]MBT3067027.1 TIGR03016 family PEP-CTERM system-associated outer membrane protein [Rhodoferax sp. U11-2br]